MTHARLGRRLGWFAAGLVLAGWLAGCSHAPRSASDCGRHFTGGSGLLGLVAAAGAFDRDAGPDCRAPAYAVTSGYIPPNEVWMPPEPAPLSSICRWNRLAFQLPFGAASGRRTTSL